MPDHQGFNIIMRLSPKHVIKRLILSNVSVTRNMAASMSIFYEVQLKCLGDNVLSRNFSRRMIEEQTMGDAIFLFPKE